MLLIVCRNRTRRHPSDSNPEKIDIDLLIVIGMTELQSTEKEIRRMSLRAFFRRLDIYLELNGKAPSKKQDNGLVHACYIE